ALTRVHLPDIPDLDAITDEAAPWAVGQIGMQRQDAHAMPAPHQLARDLKIAPAGRAFDAHRDQKDDPHGTVIFRDFSGVAAARPVRHTPPTAARRTSARRWPG